MCGIYIYIYIYKGMCVLTGMYVCMYVRLMKIKNDLFVFSICGFRFDEVVFDFSC